MTTATAVMASAFLLTFVAAAASIGGVLWFTRTKPKGRKAPQQGPTSYLEEVAARVAALEVIVQGLPSLWEEERERARKHSERAQAAERAASRLREDSEPSADAFDGGPELYQTDAFGSGAEGLHPLPEDMGLSVNQSLQARAAAALGM